MTSTLGARRAAMHEWTATRSNHLKYRRDPDRVPFLSAAGLVLGILVAGAVVTLGLTDRIGFTACVLGQSVAGLVAGFAWAELGVRRESRRRFRIVSPRRVDGTLCAPRSKRLEFASKSGEHALTTVA